MKLLGTALLCIASLITCGRSCCVFGLGLGIDIPNSWARSAKVLFFYSHPWVSLLGGHAIARSLRLGSIEARGGADKGGPGVLQVRFLSGQPWGRHHASGHKSTPSDT